MRMSTGLLWLIAIACNTMAAIVAALCSSSNARAGQAVARAVSRAASSSRHLDPVERSARHELLTSCQVLPRSRLVLSVSGGLDSMALLHIMQQIREQSLPLLFLHVAHFNHKLRPEADEEARFVAGWAAHYKLPFTLFEMPPTSLSNSSSGVQALARDWRRNEMTRILQKLQDPINETGSGIVTAHHADDQVETTLLKLLRGAHLSRLHPILPRSDCGNFVRPLLTLQKEQLREYMVTRGLEWREDSSNAERKYRRNQVRLDLIPALEGIAGGSAALKTRILSLGQQSLELRDWLHQEATAYLQESGQLEPKIEDFWDGGSGGVGSDEGNAPKPPLAGVNRLDMPVDKASRFICLPRTVQSEVLHVICSRLLGGPLDYAQTKQLVDLSLQDLENGARMKTIRISDEWTVSKIGTRLRFERNPTSGASTSEKEGLTSTSFGDRVTVVFPKCLSVNVDDTGSDEEVCNTSDKIHLHNIPFASVLRVRFPQPGDVFQPPWRNCPIKVTDFLRGKGVPLHLRDAVPVVVIDGYGIAAVGDAVSLHHQPSKNKSASADAARPDTVSISITIAHTVA